MKILSKEPLGKQDVYDIGLAEHHNFILDNGLVASNCFNKAHSISYSILTYISAYLKANYPLEFFCALLTVRAKSLQSKTWAMKAPEYVQEASTLGIEINAPSINGSDLEFTIKDDEIYFGFNAIRDVGVTAARCIVAARGNVPYKNVGDFLSRVNLRKVTIKIFQSLVKAGAFDKMGYNRAELLEKAPALYKGLRDVVEYEQRKLDIVERSEHNRKTTILIDRRNELRKETKKLSRQLKKASDEEKAELLPIITKLTEELQEFEDMKLRRLAPLKEKEVSEKVELQRDEQIPLNLHDIMEQAYYIGCYITIHPAKLIKNGSENIENLWIGQRASICGVVNSAKVITTKRGRKMAFLEIDDSTGIAEVTVFPKLFGKIPEDEIRTGALLSLEVKVEEEEPIFKLIAEDIQVYKEN